VGYVNKVALGQVVFPSSSGFPCQQYFIMAVHAHILYANIMNQLKSQNMD
jgi:hypothetical protein